MDQDWHALVGSFPLSIPLLLLAVPFPNATVILSLTIVTSVISPKEGVVM